jgi:MFS family permease
MAVGLGVAFLGIYIARSDNFILPLPDLESRLRLLLSQLLGVRPRTKEFLLGYPILILCGVYLNTLLARKWLWLGLAVATIAPVSLINTFCHIHTPFVVSLIRSINGVVGGILMAAVYVVLIEAFRKLWKLWVE